MGRTRTTLSVLRIWVHRVMATRTAEIEELLAGGCGPAKTGTLFRAVAIGIVLRS
jgi:hypothetical protein